MEFKRLDKKVRVYWLIWRLILLAIITGGFIIGVIKIPVKYLHVLLIPWGLLCVIVAIYTFIFPGLQYKVYKYYVDDEKIIISRGVLFRHYSVVPIIQVQDIGLSQGPIQILFKISNINISTAGSTEIINCLEQNLAKQIVDDIQVKVRNRLKRENDNATL